MTDTEMVEKCAKKFGFEPYEDQSQWKLEAPAIACKLGIWSGECIVYNPLTDDAQAMALVKRFQLCIEKTHLHASNTDTWVVYAFELIKGCDGWTENADLNRAICECVARMP